MDNAASAGSASSVAGTGAKHRFLYNGKAKDKTDSDGKKVHGMGFLCSLRKLTPPKKAATRQEARDVTIRITYS
jgi:hypothetical protein